MDNFHLKTHTSVHIQKQHPAHPTFSQSPLPPYRYLVSNQVAFIETWATVEVSLCALTLLGYVQKRPRKLDLSPEDQLATGASKYTFTPASFNWGKGEMFIITSLGCACAH